MRYYIIYETKNLINGKLYRGCHQTENLRDGYLGSGIFFLKALQKYGKENFERKILKFCETIEEMIYYESVFIDEEWVNREDTYNLQTGGLNYGILCEESRNKISTSIKKLHEEGFYDYSNRVYSSLSEETKEQISYTLVERYKNTEHHLKGVESWRKGKKSDYPVWNKGISSGPLSKETKNKISKSLKEFYDDKPGNRKGYSPWCAGTKGQGILKAWNKGIPAKKSPCPHCGKMVDPLNMKKWHGDNCKNEKRKGCVMKAFLVEGYNKLDYITGIVNWEPLHYFETLQQSFLYMDNMKEKNYETRVRLTDSPIEEITQPDEHWEIFFGL